MLKDKRFFSNKFPNDLYQRAEVLCDDIFQKRSEEKEYTQTDLVQYVLLDFLDEVRNNDSNVYIPG